MIVVNLKNDRFYSTYMRKNSEIKRSWVKEAVKKFHNQPKKNDYKIKQQSNQLHFK